MAKLRTIRNLVFPSGFPQNFEISTEEIRFFYTLVCNLRPLLMLVVSAFE